MSADNSESGQPEGAGENENLTPPPAGEGGDAPQAPVPPPEPKPFDDRQQRELDRTTHCEKRRKEVLNEKFRSAVSESLQAALDPEAARLRWRQAGLSESVASSIKVLLRSPALAKDFVDGKVGWDAAVDQARCEHPSPWKRSQAQTKAQKAKHFVRLLLKFCCKEYIHEKGVFKLVDKAAGLVPPAKRTPKE